MCDVVLHFVLYLLLKVTSQISGPGPVVVDLIIKEALLCKSHENQFTTPVWLLLDETGGESAALPDIINTQESLYLLINLCIRASEEDL